MSEGDENDEKADGEVPEIHLPSEQMAGVWANFAAVSHSPHEFTLDFMRMEAEGNRGIVVARVSVSPLFISQFIDALNTNWASYAEKALPREVNDESVDRSQDEDQADAAGS